MAQIAQREAVLSLLKQSTEALGLADIRSRLNYVVPPRTLRRWLAQWMDENIVSRSGAGRSTCYQYKKQDYHGSRLWDKGSFGFLQGLDADLKTGLLGQIRDLWTHTSTALAGNTLSLSEIHFILEEGLTIAGKPFRDHQEVVSHALAIEQLYRYLSGPVTEEIIFSLHSILQTMVVGDIYKPVGAWKHEINSAYTVGSDGRQVFIEYAIPAFVPVLMEEVIRTVNTIRHADVTPDNAHEYYAKIHAGVAHIHPFWDGNGRMARLLANFPLLQAGCPPLVIHQQDRRDYEQTLADYQVRVGQLTEKSGVWPDISQLAGFSDFCAASYEHTRTLVADALALQGKRHSAAAA